MSRHTLTLTIDKRELSVEFSGDEIEGAYWTDRAEDKTISETELTEAELDTHAGRIGEEIAEYWQENQDRALDDYRDAKYYRDQGDA